MDWTTWACVRSFEPRRTCVARCSSVSEMQRSNRRADTNTRADRLMTRFHQPLVIVLLLVCAMTPHAIAQSIGHVQGVVADDLGGVLPGVTVTISGADGQPLAVVVTDAVGSYSAPVPASPIHLTISLEGFQPVELDVSAATGTELTLPLQHLALAPHAETVVVQGHLPLDPPEPAPKPRPRVAPQIRPVEAHDRDSICGPAKPDTTSSTLGVVKALRYTPGPALFAAPDEVVIQGGTDSGISPGQNLVARRTFRVSGDAHGLVGEHGAGLLQIVDATEQTATAVIVYTCDEIRAGDRLTVFDPAPMRAPEPFGVPAWDDAAQILFADSGELMGAPHRLLVVDHGFSSDVRVGQRLTLFSRRHNARTRPTVLGDAIVVAVRRDSATIRVERAVDAIEPGDWAAPQRFAGTSR